jgi:hypothetical protein
MKTDTIYHLSSPELEQLEREEFEALERQSMQTLRNEPEPIIEPRIAQYLDDVERLSAADLVMLLRHADKTAKDRNEIERARISQAGRRIAAEILDGCKKLERYRPDDELPHFLREGSDVPIRALAD